MKNTIELYCFCGENVEFEIDLPEGWATRYDNLSDENAFCQKHIKAYDFAKDQCPGCVGGWGDCSLFAAFAYSGRRTITEEHLKIIEQGTCPFRTNGTFGFDSRTGVFTDFNLSDPATVESGVVLAQGIRDYIEKYKDE